VDRDDSLHPENWRGGPSYGLRMAWAPGARRAWLARPVAEPRPFPRPNRPADDARRTGGYKGYGLLRRRDGTEVGCLVRAFLRGRPDRLR
jgi:hypothetical protein